MIREDDKVKLKSSEIVSVFNKTETLLVTV
jgi:hypothetical protein